MVEFLFECPTSRCFHRYYVHVSVWWTVSTFSWDSFTRSTSSSRLRFRGSLSVFSSKTECILLSVSMTPASTVTLIVNVVTITRDRRICKRMRDLVTSDGLSRFTWDGGSGIARSVTSRRGQFVENLLLIPIGQSWVVGRGL